MELEKLRFFDFRNFKNLDLSFKKGLNIIYGKNAQGKTNILEGIYLLCNFKPIVATREVELIRQQQPLAYIKGVFKSETGALEREITLFRDKKKIVKESGKKIHRLSEVRPDINAVFFSPDDINIIKGEPGLRRKYLDDILYQVRPSHYKYLQNYYRVLSQRNNLLKLIKKDRKLINTLDSWDEQLAGFGDRFVKERLKLLEVISNKVRELFLKFVEKQAKINIKYISSVRAKGIQSYKNDFRQLLISNRNTDILRSYTTIGPHRDNIIFYIDDLDARYYASQGQQRLLTLCLKFAQRDILKDFTGVYPLMLLDDVMSELDYDKRKAILEEKQQQIFLTTTDLIHIPEEDLNNAHTFHI